MVYYNLLNKTDEMQKNIDNQEDEDIELQNIDSETAQQVNAFIATVGAIPRLHFSPNVVQKRKFNY